MIAWKIIELDMITNVVDSFQFIITFAFTISEIIRLSVNIYFKSGPTSVTGNTGIMGDREKMYLSLQQANDFARETHSCLVLF